MSLHKAELKILPVFPYEGLEDDAGEQGQQGGNGTEPAHDKGGVAGDQPGGKVLSKHRKKEQAGQCCQKQGYKTEKGQGPIVPVQPQDSL